MKVRVQRKILREDGLLGGLSSWLVRDNGKELRFPGELAYDLAVALRDLLKDPSKTTVAAATGFGSCNLSAGRRRQGEGEPYKISAFYLERWWNLYFSEAEAISAIRVLLQFTKTESYHQICYAQKQAQGQWLSVGRKKPPGTSYVTDLRARDKKKRKAS